MPSPSKRKGNAFEREIVKEAQARGLMAERMWGSDGRSKGLQKEVDVLVGPCEKKIYSLQCKRVASIGAKYQPQHGIYGQVFRADRGESMIMIRFSDFLDLIKSNTGGGG